MLRADPHTWFLLLSSIFLSFVSYTLSPLHNLSASCWDNVLMNTGV